MMGQHSIPNLHYEKSGAILVLVFLRMLQWSALMCAPQSNLTEDLHKQKIGRDHRHTEIQLRKTCISELD
jgi:hypothetical protein